MTVPVSVEQRWDRVRGSMAEEGAYALLVFAPADCRYLTGFTGQAVCVALTAEHVALVTDSRFTVQAQREIPGIAVLLADDGREEPAVRFLAGITDCGRAGRPSAHDLLVAVDAGRLPVRSWDRLRKLLDDRGLGWKLVDGLCEKARQVKFPDELSAMRAAGALAVSAYSHLETLRVVGRTELDVALDLEIHLRRNGSEGIPFPFIVAAGPRGAMPHGEASTAIIQEGQLIVLDIGAVVGGYASDVTRTYATGVLETELSEAYELVREAQGLARAAARSGLACEELDRVARDHIARAGLAERFVHSLGHGLGLEVHEGPGVGPRSTEVLREGMVVTIEPGIYLPNRGGVRIEDSVVVTGTGAEVLTEYPRELRVLV